MLCASHNITLVEIPYWWDEKKPSLLATLQKIRPDIVKQKVDSTPIPTIRPAQERKRISSRTAKQVHFASPIRWKPNVHDPAGFWMIKTYGGIPVMWDGQGSFCFKNKRITVPNEMERYLPNRISLDGELLYKGKPIQLTEENLLNMPWKGK
jgi:hypothetical protein